MNKPDASLDRLNVLWIKLSASVRCSPFNAGVLDLERREILTEAFMAKTRTARIVPISVRLKAVLEMRRLDPVGQEFGPEAYAFGNDVGERVGSIRETWEAARDAAGLTGLQLRDLRHEAGSRFDEAGVPTNYVSKLFGHTNLTTTSRYLNIHRCGLQLAMPPAVVEPRYGTLRGQLGRSLRTTLS
jgi:integrase